MKTKKLNCRHNSRIQSNNRRNRGDFIDWFLVF